jgi:hypothetical protein
MPADSKRFISIFGSIYITFLAKYLKDETTTHLGLLIHGDFGIRNVKTGKRIMTNNFRITADQQMDVTVHAWLVSQPQTFYSEVIKQIVRWWTKCTVNQGDYVEKLCSCKIPALVFYRYETYSAENYWLTLVYIYIYKHINLILYVPLKVSGFYSLFWE